MKTLHPLGDVRALSIRSPWWWFILQGFKGIENRPARYGFKGTILVHASKFGKVDEVLADLVTANGMNIRQIQFQGCNVPKRPLMPNWDELRASSGCIVGQVDLIGCTTDSQSKWFVGPFGLMLQNPIAYKTPIRAKGALGLWRPAPAVLDQLAEYRRSEIA